MFGPASAATAGIENLYKTDRLILRPIEDNEEDRLFVHRSLQSDPLNMALCSPTLLRPESTKSMESLFAGLTKALLAVMICLPASEEAARLPYVEQLAGVGGDSEADDDDDAKEKKKKKSKPNIIPIGYLCANFGGGSEAAYRHHHATANLGITIAAAYQGRGYGAEAINWATDWAFRFAGMHRVTLDAVAYNERACALYQRLGFKVDGRHREAHYHDRRWWDALSLSMLEGEWEVLRGLRKEGTG